VRAIEEEALAGGPGHTAAEAAVQKATPLGQRVGHAVAKGEPPFRRGAPVVGQALGGVDAAQHEGDVGSRGAVEECHVLDRLAVRAPLGVDLAAAAVDGYCPQVWLTVHPLSPEPAVGLEAAKADIGDGWESSFAQLVIKTEGDPDRGELGTFCGIQPP